MQTTESSPTFADAPSAFQLQLSEERRLELLGTAPGTPNATPIVLHAMRLVVQVLKAWLRLMAERDESHLPPMVHAVQVEHGVPGVLARCASLARMWADHDGQTAELVQQTMLREVERLLGQDHSGSAKETLAKAQSLLFLLTAVSFGFDSSASLPHADVTKILIEVWTAKEELAATGLFARSEIVHKAIDWHDWALVQAKRRTLLSLSHLEWAWSIQAGYPVLTCFELGPLYAPAAGYLWRETDEASWKQSYTAWLRRWNGEGYRMAEFFQIDPLKSLDERSEMWLAEADEFGVVLMAEGMSGAPLCTLALR